MYHRVGSDRTAQSVPESPRGTGPSDAALLALSRVRKALTDYLPGMHLDGEKWRAILAAPLPDPAREAERWFARGWLHWLAGDNATAEPLLSEAVARARREDGTLAESAYWLGRVRVLLGRPDAVAEFEAVLRTLGGSPQTTAWFVDLLWRTGRTDRAEQVWKSVRGNRRVIARDEGPLLEARSLLWHGETAAAERTLKEAAPRNGVVQVERSLLLAWALAARKQFEPALEQLRQAEGGPYPPEALRTWRRLLERRQKNEPVAEEAEATSPALAAFLSGQRARLAGQTNQALAAYREALASPAVQPFARYALACLGQGDFATLLNSQPGLFLAVRCRTGLVLERFRQRQAGPAEWLDALQKAASAGYQGAAALHFRRLAEALQKRKPSEAELRALVEEISPGDAAGQRNGLRAALELTDTRFPPKTALDLLLRWASAGLPALDEELRRYVGRQLLRHLLELASRSPDVAMAESAEVLAAAGRLLDGHPYVALVQALIQPSAVAPVSVVVTDVPLAVRLWEAAQVLSRRDSFTSETTPDTLNELDRWREEVRQLRTQPRLRGLAQALLLQESAQRGDVAAVAGLLDEVDAWRSFHAGPPRLVTRTLAAILAAQPAHPAWRRSLGRWLQVWDAAILDAETRALAVQAGLSPARPETAEPPAAQAPAPWFLHQAAKALGRDDPGAALVFVERALAVDPASNGVADALPELQRLARERALAAVVRPEGDSSLSPPGLLADAVELLAALPEGDELFSAALRGDRAGAWAILNLLSEQPDLSPRLAHHLALIQQRTALSFEERGPFDAAEPHWRRAWTCWLRVLSGAPEAAPVRDWLFAVHRRRINDLLARDDVGQARRVWNLVQELPGLAGRVSETLGRDFADRVDRFRDDLATEYLLGTREAMRYGTIPEGWHADYEKGLGLLRRLLSLDRDNARLLTCLVEVCAEWFLDLYNANDPAGLWEQVERFTPFALQLARLTESRPGDLAARAALADFYKFRGFVASDRGRKLALYREALRFDPANENVRRLLMELEPPAEAAPGRSPKPEEG
jgi:hypothetical protein